MIRFILVCIVVIGYLILSIPILLVEWIIGKFSPMTKDISSLRIIQAVFRFILWITGAKVTVIGEENVPKDTPVLYIGNHRSYFDILLTYSRCPIRTGYIAKKEMEKIPLLSTWMKYLHCLFLDRKDIKQGLKTILAAVDKVKSGISICIFPEGTRNKNTDDLDMLPFHEGSFKIATKTKCPIIPIAINNSADIFEWNTASPSTLMSWTKKQRSILANIPRASSTKCLKKINLLPSNQYPELFRISTGSEQFRVKFSKL